MKYIILAATLCLLASCSLISCSSVQGACAKFTGNLNQTCDALAAACKTGTGFVCSVVPEPTPTPAMAELKCR